MSETLALLHHHTYDMQMLEAAPPGATPIAERLPRLWELITRTDLDSRELAIAVLELVKRELGFSFGAAGRVEAGELCLDCCTAGLEQPRIRLQQTVFSSRVEVGDQEYAVAFGGRATVDHALELADGDYVRQAARFVVKLLAERRRTQRALADVYADALTGLPTEIFCRQRVREQCNAAAARPFDFAVMRVGLHGIEDLKKAHGATASEQVIVDAAKRLRTAVGGSDLLGRLGEADFCILIGRMTTPFEAAQAAERILSSLATPFFAGASELTLGANAGIAVYGNDGRAAEEILNRAQDALNMATQAGNCRYRFSSPEIGGEVAKRTEMESALRRALERHEFGLFFQPCIELCSGAVSGVEALIRWHDPGRGLVAPNDFIHIAEDAGLMVPIGTWVVRAALAQSKSWADKGLRLQMAINISKSHFDSPSFAKQIAAALKQTGADANMIELEINESVAMQHSGIMQTLADLRRLGLRIGIDDFGTGYSSLAYLKGLPVDSIKIDRTFISGVPADNDDSSIVRAIVAFALCTGREVRVEGVESIAQAQWLNAEGCDVAQGYFFGKPMDADAFERWLDGYEAERVALEA